MIKTRYFFPILTLTLLITIMPLTAQRRIQPLCPLSEMRPGHWTMLSPGGDTRCARDTDYHFYVHPAADGNTDKLMIYFQGGGACWNSLTCQQNGATFDDFVNSPPVEIGFYNGIFDFENPANPVADYNFVFVPYCTGDVHVGDATVEYRDDLTIHHNGYKNAAAVLDWTYANFSAPQEIVVTGSSAGAYGAIYHAPYVLNQYPEAKTLVLGDAGVGATPAGWKVLQQWGMYTNMPPFIPDLANVDQDTFTINVLYDTNAVTYPEAQFAQYTTAADEVQVLFYGFSVFGNLLAAPWEKIMYANLDGLDAAHENFASLVVGGKSHTILASPEFYTYGVNGTTVRDWFTALIAGEKVENLRCMECVEAEVITP